MKTIYTDRYGALTWAFAFVAAVSLLSAYDRFGHWTSFVSLASALFFGGMSIREWRRRRVAKQNGLDPTIVKVVE